MITDRNLEQGMKLVAKFKKQQYSAEVVEAEHDDFAGSKDEGLRIKLADGRVFRSVSSAAGAITGGSINGWRFWNMPGQEISEPKAAKKTAKAEQPPAADGGQEPWMKKLERDMAETPQEQAGKEGPKIVKQARKVAAKQPATPKAPKKARAAKTK